jgi:hypothetical protein
MIRRLAPSARETLLVKCWMSHDARWFMAVAQEYGLLIANRLNQVAAHEVGKVEAQRIARLLQLPPVKTLDEYLLAQEIIINLLGPDLLDYSVTKIDSAISQMQVRRCFAYDNAVRAEITHQFDCGVFARVTGWLEALGLSYELNPTLGKCLKAQGRECIYQISLRQRSETDEKNEDV